jgi:hypothetical protein
VTGRDDEIGQMTNSNPPYRFDIDECDVIDKEKLVSFRAKRREWVDLLDHDEQSVSGQLATLAWNDAVFRLFNEGWRQHDDARPTASMNRQLHQALTNGYVANLVLGVSRLTDAGKVTRNNDKNVVSLRRVFDDVRANCGLITREVFVCYDGMVYDTATIPPPSSRGLVSGVVRSEPIGGPHDDLTPELLHEKFDWLSGVPKAARGRTDLIAAPIFNRIETLLSDPAVKAIRLLRDKVLAHSADASSRASVSLKRYGFTLAEAEAALKALVKANRAVQIDLLWNSAGSVLPVAQSDVIEHLDLPYTLSEHIGALGQFWDGLVTDRESWVK